MKTFRKQVSSEQETQRFANALANALSVPCILFLKGQLGAGKTTLTRYLLQHFNYNGKVKSPTYTLVEPYYLSNKTIFHFDLYRLQQAEELLHMGITDYFAEPALFIIEWPEKGMPILPTPDMTCQIEIIPTGRAFALTAHSERGEAVLKQLHEQMPHE